jgi:AcrR family transcriptional regulator
MSAAAPTEAGTRERLVESSVELFRLRGYTGTGLKAILAASHAPFGSLYHFFPGGKEELGVAALHAGGATYRELVEAVYAEGVDVVTATANFYEGAAAVVEETDFADACPIATVALEVASTSDAMRNAAAECSSRGWPCSRSDSPTPESNRAGHASSRSSCSAQSKARSC